MLFAPSDEIVELKLGPQLGSWARLPPAEAAKTVLVSDKNFVISTLAILSFLLAAAATLGGIILWKHPAAGLFSGVAVLGTLLFGVAKLSHAVHRAHRLGVFEQGIRYGSDLIRFEDLKLLSLGAPKTIAERHLPTLRKMQRNVDRVPEIAQKRDVTRKLTVTPILNNGKHRVWLGLLGMFSKAHLDEFYDLIKARCPEKVFGTDLTPEERQKIEEL